MKSALTFFVGLILGFVAHALSNNSLDLRHHRRVVAEWTAYMKDARTSEKKPDRPHPLPPNPSLDALDQAGELRHVDLVFPRIHGRDATLFWLHYCDTNPAIVYSSGNPSYPDLKPSGNQPLHLDLWFIPGKEIVVENLIRELEANFALDTQLDEKK